MKSKFLVGLLAFTVAAGSARCYNLIDPVAVWSPGSIPLDIKLGATPTSDFGTFDSSARAAASLWNSKLGVVQFDARTSSVDAAVQGNRRNELAFSSTVGGRAFGSGVLAITLTATSRSVYQTLESDILFNTAVTWDSYRGAHRPEAEDIYRVALHELGHVLGLDHADRDFTPSVPALMNSHVSDLDTLAADDVIGAQSLYRGPGQTAPPANDAFAAAVLLPNDVNSKTTSGTTLFATAEPAEPDHAEKPGHHSAWWRWIAPSTGTVTFDTQGSHFDTVLAVYTGTTLADLKQVAQNDDVDPGVLRYSSVSFTAFAGKTYWVAVDGWDGDTGFVGLNMNFPSPIVRSPPVSKTVASGQSVSFAANFSVPAGSITLQWQQLSPQGVWLDLHDDTLFHFTNGASLSFVTTPAMNGAQFRCVATNTAGWAISPPATLTVTAPPAPVIQKQPTDVTVYLGELIAFTLQVSEGGITWYHNGTVVAQSSTFAGELIRVPVRNARPEDAGTYYGVVTGLGGSVTTQTVNVTVLPLAPVTKVLRSFFSTLILRADGTRWVCGSGSDPWGFYSGDLSTPRLVTPDSASGAGVTVVKDAAVGYAHQLYVAPDGQLWAQGANDSGQLGDGTTTTRTTPVLIASGVRHVFAGLYVSYFIKEDGSLWGMGRNSTGQMGDGTTINRLSPAKIADDVRTVSTYYQATFFVKTDDTLWAMGSNFNGLIGLADAGDQTTPALLATDVADVFAGQYRSFFLKKDGSLWGMGSNISGALGDGTTTTRTTPVLVATDIIAASPGSSHSLFLKADHTLWAVGDLRQQFGQPNTDEGVHLTPVQVATNVASATAGVLASYIVGQNGDLSVTGWNTSAALGLTSAVTYQVTPTVLLRSTDIPPVSWTTPAPIIYGTPLSADQLNASSTLAGTFSYTPAAGTVLPVGAQTLRVVFTPADPTHFASVSADVPLVVKEPAHPGALVNISTRAYCATGNAVTIGGFVVTGDTPKRFLVRALGPTLSTFGLDPSEVLADPAIEVYQGASAIAANDNWADAPQAAAIPAVASAIGASPLSQTDSRSAALLLTLNPGVYTFVAHGHDAQTGVVLLEVYDADADITASRFSNISTRAHCVTGSGVAIGGFVIAGDSPRTVLLRAVGTTLGSLGLNAEELLLDPVIELHDAGHGNTIIATNDNWRDNGQDAVIAAANAHTGAIPFSADDLRSSALVVKLMPGVYSFVAHSKTSGSGILLVEVYAVD